MPIEVTLALYWVILAVIGGTLGLWCEDLAEYVRERGGLDEYMTALEGMVFASIMTSFHLDMLAKQAKHQERGR